MTALQRDANNVPAAGAVNPSGAVVPLNVDASNNLKVTGSIENYAQAGAIALTSPPANTNAGSNTTLTFSQQVKHWIIQNNTSANAYVELDATASTGSTLLPSLTLWRDDIQVTAIHIYTAAAQPINAANGIVVKGWL